MSSLLASIPRTYPASLLLNFDGANNSTTFTDSSSNNLTATRNGNTIISTTESKFGNSSGYFDGTGDYLAFSGTEFNFASSDFTIEAWIRPSSVTGTRVIFSKRASTAIYGGLVFFVNGNLLGFSATNNGSSWGVDFNSGSSTLSINTWYHVAVTRNNNTFRIFLNGIEVGSQTINSFIISTNAHNVVIGAGGAIGGEEFFGYIDDLRITKNIALYQTGYFIPPTSSLSKNATIAPKLYNHIVMTSTKSSGDITGSVSTSTGYYTVNWWDGTKTTYASGASFAKAAIGGNQSITIYPSSSNGSLDGYFYNIDVSNNNLTSVRPFYSRFIVGPGTAGYSQYGYFYYSYYSRGWRWNWIPGIPGVEYHLNISSNSLDSSALNQVYTDLLNGNGSIEVSDNTGGDADDPTIATNKGYTVFGSLSPIVELLLNLNGSNGSTTFTDSSSNSRSITLQTGSPSLNTTTKKYGSASLSINSGSIGNESYIISDLSNMDWSIEFWIYRPTETAAYEGLVYLANSTGADNNSGVNIHLYTSNDIHFNNNGTGAVTSSCNVSSGTWHHVVCAQDSKYKKVYFNGILVGVAEQPTPAGPYRLRLGRSYGFWASSASSAYIDDFKLVRGKCSYYQDFVVPSAEATTSTTAATQGTTVLLLKGNGANNGIVFTDDGHKALTATRNGNTITSTTEYKYGTASIYFDGTGDYLSYSTGKDNFNLFNSNFTIECWIRPSNVTGARVIFSKRANTGTYGGFIFQCNGNKLNILATNNGSSWGINLDSTSTLSTNTWYHVAVTRLYDTFKIFIDGNLEGSQTIEDFIISTNTDNVVIGAGGATGGQEFFGYIDDLRIVRGASLYNNNFTPPTSQLAVYP
jgi:hypothetical protein